MCHVFCFLRDESNRCILRRKITVILYLVMLAVRMPLCCYHEVCVICLSVRVGSLSTPVCACVCQYVGMGVMYLTYLHL